MVVWCLFLSRLVVSARLYRGVWELLVQWDGADATWTPLEDFKTAYPSFQLEDELFQGGGSVVDSFYLKHTYGHRRKPIEATTHKSG
jgi:hypothetical protein